MNKLNRNVLHELALYLDALDILNFCLSNKRIKRMIWDEEPIWIAKLKREFPDEKGFEEMKFQEKYRLLYTLRILKQKLNMEESLEEIYKLKDLVLSDKRLTYLPKSIGNLSNLKFLWLDYNRLAFLPKSLKNIPNLEIL